MHVETREGRTGTSRYGARLVDLGKGCEVEVRIPLVPECALMSPGPGATLWKTWGWKPLLRTPSAGIWVLPGALRNEGFLAALGVACSWVGCHRTALGGMSLVWLSMLVLVRARLSYRATQWTWMFSLSSSVWRALAHQMSPWCAEGDVPSAANLNFYGGSRSHV